MDSLYFTLCSNNYLPFALSLGKSVKSFSPNARFIIGLVDRYDSQLDYSKWEDFEFLTCLDLGYNEFENMLSRYNIIEFNTAVKPFYFEFLFANNPEVDQIYYLDPDLCFYQSPKVMDDEWGDAEILLTPNLIHTSSKPSTGELASLRHGMYNLGFLGLRRGAESFRLIQWWKERLIEYCRIDKCNGIFVDQKWMDLAPLFFDKIKSVKSPGWNMAWWNFSERELLKTDGGFAVNRSDIPLVFFHFSGFKPHNAHYTERLKANDPKYLEYGALVDFYEDYGKNLLKNGYNFFSEIKPSLKFKDDTKSFWQKTGRKIKSKIIKVIDSVFQI